MKIDDVISGKNEPEEVNLDGLSIPIKTLKDLKEEGYEYLKPIDDRKTLALWGKSRSACFTGQQLRERA